MIKAVADYLKLVTSQYQTSPKFMAWVATNLDYLNDISICSDTLDYFFDIDNAVGVQLDILGQIVGQSRYLTFQPTDGSAPFLTDALYRNVLKFKIGMNHWDGQISSIESLWKRLFPNTMVTVIDNQDMSIGIVITGALPQIVVDLINNDMIIPRPEAVKINYGNVPETIKYFAFDLQNQFYDGFDLGYWDLSVNAEPYYIWMDGIEWATNREWGHP